MKTVRMELPAKYYGAFELLKEYLESYDIVNVEVGGDCASADAVFKLVSKDRKPMTREEREYFKRFYVRKIKEVLSDKNVQRKEFARYVGMTCSSLNVLLSNKALKVESYRRLAESAEAFMEMKRCENIDEVKTLKRIG